MRSTLRYLPLGLLVFSYKYVTHTLDYLLFALCISIYISYLQLCILFNILYSFYHILFLLFLYVLIVLLLISCFISRCLPLRVKK